jgi:hypothetical protein
VEGRSVAPIDSGAAEIGQPKVRAVAARMGIVNAAGHLQRQSSGGRAKNSPRARPVAFDSGSTWRGTGQARNGRRSFPIRRPVRRPGRGSRRGLRNAVPGSVHRSVSTMARCAGALRAVERPTVAPAGSAWSSRAGNGERGRPDRYPLLASNRDVVSSGPVARSLRPTDTTGLTAAEPPIARRCRRAESCAGRV